MQIRHARAVMRTVCSRIALRDARETALARRRARAERSARSTITLAHDVEHYESKGLREFDCGAVGRFLTGALGVTRYVTTGDNEVLFVCAGGGVKVPPAGTIRVRLESRILTTFVDEPRPCACVR